VRVRTLSVHSTRPTVRNWQRSLAAVIVLVLAWTITPSGPPVTQAAAAPRAEVNGRVADAATGAGLRAIVTASGRVGAVSSSAAVQTDGSGFYRLQVPVGTYTVTASRSGYADQSRRLTLRQGATTLNFRLQPLAAAKHGPTPTPKPPAPTATAAPTPAPVPTVTPQPGPTPPPPAGVRRWSDPQSWPGGRVPTRNDSAVIPAGVVLEVDTTAAEARTLTVEGTLRASRQVASQLTLYGNMIVQNAGVLDYGRPQDRVLVPAAIRWSLNEAAYVGGDTMAPVATDVGLWAIDDAQVWIHGAYRDTWSPLTRPARAGAVDITVDPTYAVGWQVGDQVVVGPSHVKTSYTDDRDEVRRIVAVLGGGMFRLNAPLLNDHDVLAVTWTDAWGDTWTETLAAKVVNLTSNIMFQAVDPNNRPHVMFMDRAKHYVEDLAVENFSPMPKVNPMSRYAWHEHRQGDGSRGSYLRRVRLYGGPGDGWHIHNAYGIEAQDVVVYNQARAYVVRPDGTWFTNTQPIMLERDRGSGGSQFRAADDCWLDRPLVMRWGAGTRDYRNSGIWLTGSVNCAVVGAVATGGGGQSRSSGMHWEEGGAGGGETAYVYRAEAHSNQVMGFHSWQNNTPTQRIVDLLTWRNGESGVGWGAYGTRYWAHQVRAIGNRNAQLAHWASGWGITGFLADGLGQGAGIEIRNYVSPSTSDSVYEDGVVRNVQVNARHLPGTSTSGVVSWIQFARISWDPARPIQFGSGAIPPVGSRLRFRGQTGLQRSANFTLYRLNDPNVPGSITDLEYNARRVDNDSAGTRPRPPRVRLVTPDDVVTTGVIRLEVETDAPQVDFYQANHLLARVAPVGGRASLDFDMSTFPRRRAYFWALATGTNGAVNTSRVIRVRRF